MLRAVLASPRLAISVALGLLLAGAQDVRAESDLLLPMPTSFGVVPASTYDVHGRRVGDAHLAVERMPDGRVRMVAESGIQGAERNVVTAMLEPLKGGSALRLLEQSSRSFDATGGALGEMRVDHTAREGRCIPPNGNSAAPALALPELDRVANIPVNLLLLPLARGERDRIEFQLMLCRGGPRVVEATAEVARRVHTEDGPRDIVEIRYDVDLGSALFSSMVRPFVPKVAVWFDPAHPDGWLAHRMPLFAQGPTVMVVRTGVAPEWLGD
jgi:hypothetical protein